MAQEEDHQNTKNSSSHFLLNSKLSKEKKGKGKDLRMEEELKRLKEENERLRKENEEMRKEIKKVELDSLQDIQKVGEEKKEEVELSKEEIKRYSRHLIMESLSIEGQRKLKRSKVLVVGAGGLGSSVLMYLAAAGVGSLGIIDFDSVEVSNLQRQVIHGEKNVGESKALSAKKRLLEINSSLKCFALQQILNKDNAKQIVYPYDVIVDATDNVHFLFFHFLQITFSIKKVPTRYLLNDVCVLLNKPLISGSALGMQGQLTIYNYQGGPCYRCLFPKPPPVDSVVNCSDGGVLGAVVGVIGSIQASETVKLICSSGNLYVQKMLIADFLKGTFLVAKLRPKSKECEICGEKPVIKELIDYVQFCGTPHNDEGTHYEKFVSSLISFFWKCKLFSLKNFER